MGTGRHDQSHTRGGRRIDLRDQLHLVGCSAAALDGVGGVSLLEGPPSWGGLQWGTVGAMVLLFVIACIVIARVAQPRVKSESQVSDDR